MGPKTTTGKQALINWSKKACAKYKNVNINDFSVSWRDGIAFLGILHHFLGEDIVGDISSLEPHTNERENLDRAFAIANKIGIEQFMETNDILYGTKPEPKSMEAQVIQFYVYFKDKTAFGEDEIPRESEDEKLERLKKERLMKTMSYRPEPDKAPKDQPKVKVAIRRSVRVDSNHGGQEEFDAKRMKEIEDQIKIENDKKILEEKKRIEEELQMAEDIKKEFAEKKRKDQEQQTALEEANRKIRDEENAKKLTEILEPKVVEPSVVSTTPNTDAPTQFGYPKENIYEDTPGCASCIIL